VRYALAALESAIFGQPEQAFGVIPEQRVQHLARLMGRARRSR